MIKHYWHHNASLNSNQSIREIELSVLFDVRFEARGSVVPRAFKVSIFKSNLVYFTRSVFIQRLMLSIFSSYGNPVQNNVISAVCISTIVGFCCCCFLNKLLLLLQENPYLFTYRNSNYSLFQEISNTKETLQVT